MNIPILEILRELVTYRPEAPMLFNSWQFLTFFSVFITIYALIVQNKTVRTLYVLCFSLFFYYKSSGFYLVILLFSIIIDYFVAIWVSNPDQKGRKWLLIGSISANVGLLFYFKYTNFFLSNLAWIQGKSFQPLDIFLPIGISFYTFQTISYVVDAYKGVIQPTKNLIDYAFYMSYFPHLVAGPIVRAKHFLPQITQTINLKSEDIGLGIYLVFKGLIKKTIVADYLSQYNDLVFANPDGFSGFENLMAMYGYAMQIFCDFSGYTDMAIGFAKIMGFDLGENFRSPYQAANLTDFWRRWHIALSSWLRDYIYIPLGGNRYGKFRQNLNQLLTMLIGGFWHGASWKFIAWGGLHGIGLIVHKLFDAAFSQAKFREHWLWNGFSIFLTFHFVAFVWLFFRATDFSIAIQMMEQIFFHMDWAYLLPFVNARALFTFILIASFILQTLPLDWKQTFSDWFMKLPWVIQAVFFLLVIQLLLQLKAEGVQPFIYFQF
ncbi:MAG: MBOAT family protein [Bacteroidia bacterium]|nr:MBOAT family protein [Bacteroidia bacterium]